MSDPFIGEVRVFSYNFIPQGWKACDGSELNVAQYQALYAIIGNTFGGSPSKTFKVPDLRGQAVSGAGTGAGLTPRNLGNTYGVQTVTLTESQMPAHTHPLQRQTNAKGVPTGKTAAPDSKSDLATLSILESSKWTNIATFQNSGSPNTTLHPSTITPSGSTQPSAHNNMQPYQAIQFCIAYLGIFPSWD